MIKKLLITKAYNLILLVVNCSDAIMTKITLNLTLKDLGFYLKNLKKCHLIYKII